jgi:hypothetical protein
MITSRSVWSCLLLVLVTASPIQAQNRFKFKNPGAAATEALDDFRSGAYGRRGIFTGHEAALLQQVSAPN